jgi:membrane-associated protein
MEFVTDLVGFVLHIDRHLDEIIRMFGPWTYVLLFLVLFCETGLVITPFLPGDSLLFAVGTFAARGSLDLALVFTLLFAAAIIGDNTNYWIGRRVGPKIFHREDVRLLNRRHLDRAHAFYEKHGVKTIIIARFLPIIRTFTPFVAGIGAMNYRRFLPFDIFGGLLWVGLFVFGGYFFGNIPVVRRNFTLVILAIIFISILPALIEAWRHRRRAQTA